MTAEIGRVLGGRYRLVAPIGLGASAQVYLADDVRLRRRVAVKMLHDALAGDVEFLRRFRAEARAAAALNHPNVMAVYDWGDDDVAFIVTEYLGGGSLRGLLDRGELLTPSQALSVGLEATRALDYAHRRGFVHRDIKPANLLFGEEQRLRIADFGLARALAEAAWTEPQGAMLGTARYASPEQAKGEKLGVKADVYSLALVLVEAVTGDVPFAADTTLGTLMARVDRPLVVPEELGPLRRVIERAGHPDPDQRIDARTFAGGLLRAAKELARPMPLPLAGALPPAGEALADADPTVHAPVVAKAPAPDLTDDDLDLDPPHWVNQSDAPGAAAAAGGLGAALVGAGVLGGAGGAGGIDAEPDEERVAVVAAAVSAATEGRSDPEAEGNDAGPGDAEADGEPVTGELDTLDDDAPAAFDHDPDADHDLGLGPAAVAGAAAWSDADGDGGEPTGPVDEVDRVVDPTAVIAVAPTTAPTAARPIPAPAYAAAVTDDAEDHDGPRRRRRWPWVALVVLLLLGAGGVAAATVLQEDPEPPPARVVELPLPEVVGLDQEAATEVLEAAGWDVVVETRRQNDTTRGEVLGSAPEAGTRLVRGQEVTITVSEGQEIVPVPQELAGRPLAEAQLVLFEAGIIGEEAGREHHEEIPAGSVVKAVDGTPAEIERGSTVGLVVSDGPRPRTVPGGLQGRSEAEATGIIEAEGLSVAVNRQFNEDVAEGNVVSQTPAPGTSLPRGEVVTIEVSRGPELVAVPDVSGADTAPQAAALLREAGLQPGEVSGPAEGTPAATSPAAGEEVRKGTTVDIVVR